MTFEDTRNLMLGSYLDFMRTFYELKTGREFLISNPVGRESHMITIAKELKAVFNGDTTRLLINVPPGHGKSTMLVYWIAWCIANYPDCNFLYISYSHELAEKHTATIKEILEMAEFKRLFGVELSPDSKAKGSFKTLAGGCVKAFGSAGGITGQDAGLPNCDRFSGAVVIDDSHKPDEVHSDTLRDKVIFNYNETIKPRPRGPKVPIVFIGQRLHEADLPAFFIDAKDGYTWKKVILKSIDDAGNALYPEVNTIEKLRIEEQFNPYVFASQYQQNPQPAGGGIFKPEWFIELDEEPNIISTFITADTAETAKDYNDASVFSFFGIYRIIHREIDTGLYGLHWLDCRELRCEPKDLESEFYDFYFGCMRYRVKPDTACIERKSTGVTLCSVLKGTPGLRILDIERTREGGSKTARFLACQPFTSRHQVTFPAGAKHNKMVIEHLRKITSNDTHRFDDIADTMQCAIQVALLEQTLLPRVDTSRDNILSSLAQRSSHLNNLRRQI